MNIRRALRKLWLLPLATTLAISTARAQEEDSCTLPGVLVVEDASGDSVDGSDFSDIQTLHMAEPAAMSGKLVFTYKMADLSIVPPNVGYVLRLSTEIAPPNGDEDYFVAMFTGPIGSPSFAHGTTGTAGAGPRLFTIEGDLDSASNFKADGTITLVLDKSRIPAMDVGLEVFNILPTVRLFTPTNDAGVTTNGANETIVDDAGSGFYAVVGNESCGEGKSGLLGVGGLPPLALLMLAGFAALGFRLRRRAR